MNGNEPVSSLPTEVIRPHRVLLVDDDPSVLRLLTHLLRKSGYEVAASQTAREAISLLNRFQFDCILSDAMMPDLTGFDFVRLVRDEARFASMPILMLTRNRTLQDVKRAVDLGVSEYILKPIDTQLLLEKLEYCLAKADRPGGRFFELVLTGGQTSGKIQLSCEVRTISESGLTLATESRIVGKELQNLDLAIFKEIGISPPHLRQTSTLTEELTPGRSTHISHFSFVGLTEDDLKKIRIWMQKESARRRKT